MRLCPLEGLPFLHSTKLRTKLVTYGSQEDIQDADYSMHEIQEAPDLWRYIDSETFWILEHYRFQMVGLWMLNLHQPNERQIMFVWDHFDVYVF